MTRHCLAQRWRSQPTSLQLQLLLSGAAAVAVLFGPASAGGVELTNQQIALHGLRRVGLAMDPPAADGRRLGLTEQALRQTAYASLRRHLPYLRLSGAVREMVRISVRTQGELGKGKTIASVCQLQVREPVLLVRSGAVVMAATFDETKVCALSDGDADAHRKQVFDAIDQLVAALAGDLVAANGPDAEQQVQQHARKWFWLTLTGLKRARNQIVTAHTTTRPTETAWRQELMACGEAANAAETKLLQRIDPSAANRPVGSFMDRLEGDWRTGHPQGYKGSPAP